MTEMQTSKTDDDMLALLAETGRLRGVLAAALDCVVAMDASGTVVAWNPAAERTFGWSAAEATGRDMADLIVPTALRERHRAGLARYVSGGAPVLLDRRIEITAAHRDGHELPVELTITAIEGEHGDRPLFLGYVRDISDRLAAEEELRASRVRIVTAADDARRRIERDLHDGAQQHLVGLALTLRLVRGKLESDPVLAAELLDEAVEDLATATAELRELARGIHPAVLTEGGLEPALTGLSGRVAVPVTIERVPRERLAAAVEATAYFIVAEALTNVTRYAHAGRAYVDVHRDGGCLHVGVRDDGRGGADPATGSGLRGLADRVAALGGRFTVTSPPGEGTTLRAELPCAS
ncbi:MAG TPA: PAS domain S-box protein [Solirubrobacteraceae bacterium]|nr:PAS domain S-box protein [Solirubrobacteraceae bacterium]